MREKRLDMKTVLSCAKLVYSAHPVLASLEGVSYLGGAVVAGLMPLMWKYVFDAIDYTVTAGELSAMLRSMAVFAAIQVLAALFRITGRLPPRFFGYNEKLQKALAEKLYGHATRLPYADFLEENLYNSFVEADTAVSRNEAMNMINVFFQTPALVISLIIASITLWTFSPWMVAIAFVSLLPFAIAQKKNMDSMYDFRKILAPIQNKQDYFWSLFLDPEAVKEMRVYGCEEFFKEKWRGQSDALNRIKKTHQTGQAFRNTVGEAIKICGYGIGICLSALLLNFGRISVGSFGAAITSFNALQQTFNQLIVNIAEFNQSYLFYYSYREFVNREEVRLGAKSPSAKPREITLSNVRYTYPNAKRSAVENINLTISGDDHIAIVGENGSGKTTLCLLLLGLLKPQGGQITENRIDIHDLDVYPYQRLGAVFQDFMKYHMTIRENVAFGNLACMDKDSMILDTLKQVHFKEGEPFSLDRAVGTEFGGVDFSVGEWQKLAIARGYLSESDILLFDEPTAALDPLAEQEILSALIERLHTRGCVFVTHRIGSAQLADKIIVMKHGRIVEMGTHNTLLAAGGEYARLFKHQAVWYQ